MKWARAFITFWGNLEAAYIRSLEDVPHSVETAPPTAVAVPIAEKTILSDTNSLNNMTSQEQAIYGAEKADIGKAETLNEAVPIEVRCAQAWSVMARQAGIQGIPEVGFNSTNQVDEFCASSDKYERIETPEEGATIVSPSTPEQHGHVGDFAAFNVQYAGDWGIVSNDSNIGVVREQWSYKQWVAYYEGVLGLAIHIYRPIRD